jgi:hypothetical protein
VNDQTEQQQQEMNRIRTLADSVANPQEMLACILRRLDPSYFYRDDRLTTAELLKPDLQDKAKKLHRVVGASDLHNILKQRICGAAEFYLRNTCNIGPDEMLSFKSTCQFNPATYNLFAGLEGD